MHSRKSPLAQDEQVTAKGGSVTGSKNFTVN